MKRILTLTTAIALAAPVAFAQDEQNMNVDLTVYRNLDDMEVRINNDEEMGEVEEVLIDPSTKDIAVVVEVEEGFLDISDVEKVVPLSALEFDQDVFVVNISKDDVQELTDYREGS